MKATSTPLQGLMLIEPQVFNDERGFFLESFEKSRYKNLGIEEEFVQDNHSRSMKNVLRGLHFQVKRPQAQILTVIRGTVFDVCVDLRPRSKTFKQWFATELSDQGLRQIYMAPGFAHGFCVLSDWADLHYKVSRRYDPTDESGLFWNDSDVGVKWPVKNPIITTKDASFLKLRDMTEAQLPHV